MMDPGCNTALLVRPCCIIYLSTEENKISSHKEKPSNYKYGILVNMEILII